MQRHVSEIGYQRLSLVGSKAMLFELLKCSEKTKSLSFVELLPADVAVCICCVYLQSGHERLSNGKRRLSSQ